MRLLFGRKDGGIESHVFAYGLEIKSLFSVLLLRFEHGTREAYHSHAFNAISWLLSGRLNEHHYDGSVSIHYPQLSPIYTSREETHRVFSVHRSWVLSFRGPWVDQWQEEKTGRDGSTYRTTLTHGRKVVADDVV